MSDKYLMLGGSSELCLSFLKNHKWHADDEIVLQYYSNSAVLEQIKDEIPAKLYLWQADFASEESTEDFVKKLGQSGYVPTHIIHAPAVPITNARFTESGWSEAEKQLHVQCRSLMMILQGVIKKMAKCKRGKIILVLSSYCINVPPKFLSSYVMTKYALMGLGKSLAVEYASKGIHVNMISPSMMNTKFLVNVYDGIVEQSAKENPQGRNVTPDDVAGVIEYLFSDACNFVIGANVPVTGGEAF